jgi:toxin-antitoxin system PIN domain toxin
MTQDYLLDVNVLIALLDTNHEHHQIVGHWFTAHKWRTVSLCPLTEAGFLRITTNPKYPGAQRRMNEAIAVLQTFKGHPDCWYQGIDKSWVDLTVGFACQINGHKQVTDAYLLGLAILNDGVLVSFDKGLRYLAGEKFKEHLLVLK